MLSWSVDPLLGPGEAQEPGLPVGRELRTPTSPPRAGQDLLKPEFRQDLGTPVENKATGGSKRHLGLVLGTEDRGGMGEGYVQRAFPHTSP